MKVEIDGPEALFGETHIESISQIGGTEKESPAVEATPTANAAYRMNAVLRTKEAVCVMANSLNRVQIGDSTTGSADSHSFF